MEAKDTARNIRKSVELPKKKSFLNMLDFADKVAEISFKAGYDEGYDAEAWCDGFDKGKQKGIREVVEWIESNGRAGNQHWHSLLFPTLLIDIKKWQAKLKEWGI